jgi:hypothetical protein
METLEPRILMAATPLPDLAGNTTKTARVIDVTATATVCVDSVERVDLNDYYKFTITTGKCISLTLTQMTADADVQLLSSNGKVVASSVRGADDDDFLTAMVPAGTYYVRVLSFRNASTDYRLQVSAGDLPDDLAGNTKLLARDIGAMDGTAKLFADAINPLDTNDYYKFTLAAPATIAINLRNLTADASLQLIAEKSPGVKGGTLATAAHIGAVDETITKALAAGTYYVRVFPVKKAQTSYTLELGADGHTVPTPPPLPPSPAVATITSKTLADTKELDIAGSSVNDTIVVSQSGNQLTVNADGVVTTYLVSDYNQIMIHGNEGDDTITVNAGVTLNCNIYGDAGADTLTNAAYGRSTIVAIGGGSDTVTGNGFSTMFWIDSTDVSNASVTEIAAGLVHTVDAFYQPFTNISTNSKYIPLELNGQNLPDPTDSGTTERITTRSFWGNTPAVTYTNQGFLGDCYLLSTLGALANAEPSVLANTAVDLGDGTYAVQFTRGTTTTVVRVDGDLPDDSFGILYAFPGTTGGQWAPIIEKAYAMFKYADKTYASIEAGWMGDVLTDLGVANADAVAAQPDAAIYNTVITAINANKAITVGTVATIVGSAPLIEGHAYTVLGATLVNGVVTVTMRNPWGFDGVANPSNPNDGIVNVTGAQIRLNCDWFSIAS